MTQERESNILNLFQVAETRALLGTPPAGDTMFVSFVQIRAKLAQDV